MSEEVHHQLQELPDQWNNIKKLAVIVKQTVTPLQVCISQHRMQEYWHCFKHIYANLDQWELFVMYSTCIASSFSNAK